MIESYNYIISNKKKNQVNIRAGQGLKKRKKIRK